MAVANSAPLGAAHDDRRLQQFGNPQQLRLGSEDTAADEDRRLFRLPEKCRRRVEGGRIRRWVVAVGSGALQSDIILGAHDVWRHLENHRLMSVPQHLFKRFMQNIRGVRAGASARLTHLATPRMAAVW